MTSILVPLVRRLAALVGLLALPVAVAAQTSSQGGGLGSQTLGQGYLHMFIAYAVAWALVLGWAVSIARRLARVERKLEE